MDVEVQYKTALLWLHKVRQELATHANSVMLSGEVEIDGALFGGHIRPKNTDKERKGLGRVPHGAKDRELCVVVARQRNGPIRCWISKNEANAKSFIQNALDEKTVLFADGLNAWSWFRARHKLFTVNHKIQFYTPEACTNQAENFFSVLRRAESMYRHITQHYLDLYAAEAAWRITKPRKNAVAAFASIMDVMSRVGKSPLAGYFQGRKRFLEVCCPDGTTQTWRPPTPEEQRLRRAERTGVVHVGPLRPIRKGDRWKSGFEYLSAAEFVADPSKVPHSAGVYAIFLRNGVDLLRASGRSGPEGADAWSHQGALHIYTGETYSLRSRLREHLQGDWVCSNLRATLHSLQSLGNEALPDFEQDYEKATEQLDDWLLQNAVIGFKNCGYVRDAEAEILEKTASPLNISGKEGDEFAQFMKRARATLKERVKDFWPAKSTRSGHRPTRR